MKKWIIVLLFLCVIGAKPVFASSNPSENAARLPYGKNYLDYRNIIRTEPRDLDMIEPIKVKLGVTYTLIMGINYIGVDNFSQDEYPFFDLCTETECETVDLVVDIENERWYKTFVTTDDYFKFENLPVITGGYEFMLYEGAYEDFTGYEHYMSYPKTTYQGVYLVDYDNPIDETTIKQSIRAVDNYDGTANMTPIKVIDTYSNRTEKIGEFLIEYEVKDRMTNTSSYQMKVKVVDIKAPTLTGKLTYQAEASQVNLTLADIINNMSITDNVETLTSSDIEVVSDLFTPNKDSVGEFPVVLSVSDSSGNKIEQSVNVIIKDTVAPTITGPDVLYTYFNDVPKTLEQIKSLYTSYDRFDGDITSGIVVDLNGYTGNMIVVYEIYIKSTDIAGNRTIRTVHLHIIDDVAPVFSSVEPVITNEALASMTQDDLVAWFQTELLNQGLSASGVNILLNEYEHGRDLKEAYIYFEYEVDGQMYQSRAKVDIQEKGFNYTYYYIGGGLILSTVALLFYKKKFM